MAQKRQQPSGKQREKDVALWNSLNKRQRHYLKAVYIVDQENEEYWRSEGAQGNFDTPPASEWRWIHYHPIGYDGDESRLQEEIGRKLIDPGTGSTFEALEKRELIECRYETVGDFSVLYVKMTSKGRRVVRAADTEYKPKPKQPKGYLQKWHWELLALLYREGEVKRSGDEYNGQWFSWKTFLRLRDYKPEGLVRETKDGGAKLTGAGQNFYERQYRFYRREYRDVDAVPPRGDAPPQADEDDPKTQRELKELQKTVLAFCREKYGHTYSDGERGIDWYTASGDYWAIRGVPPRNNNERNYMPTLPDSRDAFFALCRFASLDPHKYPYLINLYPEPDSEREHLAAVIKAWLEAHKDPQRWRGWHADYEIEGIGQWSQRRFSSGVPMQPRTFLHVCQYMGINPEDYPLLYAQTQDVKEEDDDIDLEAVVEAVEVTEQYDDVTTPDLPAETFSEVVSETVQYNSVTQEEPPQVLTDVERIQYHLQDFLQTWEVSVPADALKLLSEELMALLQRPQTETSRPSRYRSRHPDATFEEIAWQQPQTRRTPLYEHRFTCRICGKETVLTRRSPTAPTVCEDAVCQTEARRQDTAARVRKYRERRQSGM